MAKNFRKKSLLWMTLCVLIACAVVGTVISFIKFKSNPGRTSASGSIEFSFEGAAEGIAPNGYAFNLSDLTGNTVLKAALESAGMADRYTADQIRAWIDVKGVYPENIVEQMTSYESAMDFSANRTVMASTFHPTLYSVVLYNDFDKNISRGDLEKLLGCILGEYRKHFAKTCCAGTNAVTISYTLSDYDYPQQLTILQRIIEESAAYAEEMYEKNPSVMLGGKGFNDIAVQLNNLIETDISKLSANITMKGLTKNPDRLIIQYNYEIRTLNNQLEQKNAELVQLDALVAAYDKNEIIYLSTTDSLTKIDGNSSETYDKLVEARKEVADEITTLKSQIATYELQLKDLTGETEEEETASVEKESQTAGSAVTDGTETGGSETGEADEAAVENTVPELTQEDIEAQAQAAAEAKAAETAALEADIATLTAKREKIMKDFAALIQVYNDEQINDLTVAVSDVEYETPRVISGAFIKQTLKVAGPICVVGFMVCLVIIIVSLRKENKD